MCVSFAVLATGIPRASASPVEFQSGGRRIGADYYQASGPGPHPSVLVLHGAGGTFFDGPDMRRMSRALAAAGNDVYFMHYFNRTGTWFGLDAGMQKNFPTWLATVRDAIKWVRSRQPGGGPIGIYGYSLGGFLALAAGSDNADVGAIIEQAGGAWNGKERLLGRMPPLLLVHGLEDRRVPFDRHATPLVALLKRRGMNFRTHFFPGQGHVFSQSALREVREDAVRFFGQHLAVRRSH
jgi:dienelactone hydrolase